MRRLILYIATSLDGYIARPSGEVDWLFTDQDYGYTDFLAGVDTILMGRKTYEQVLTFGEFPYHEKQNYVFSSQPDFDASPHAKTVRTDVKAFVEALRQTDGKNIWLVGGPTLIHPFIEHALLDGVVLSIHPILLGSGMPLFQTSTSTQPLNLIDCQAYSSGLVQITYTVNKPKS
ncbi:dihydrofolate reductase family protein [Stenomitos frigidus]|uniref:Dihydrofolate reductase n=1 Tax=Stenomitos frigidus ULC18 TaxID=2107698 RepID=A0A2T1DVP9_9CYAN|nr:dihydrofolate reductase family protein [Stenomitos frigidus]PSB24567.1 dihydrofolate reductase [Stenomitos frigidus ULC18]